MTAQKTTALRALVDKARTLLPVKAAEEELNSLESATPVRWRIRGDEHRWANLGDPEMIPWYIEPRTQQDGSELFAVINGQGSVLDKGGLWMREPLPSARTPDFIARCRFDTFEDALATAQAAAKARDAAA